jgi:hypothetical protein
VTLLGLNHAACRIDRVVIFRDARREDVPTIVALLADDVLGAGREAAADDDAYQTAFGQITADPRSRLIVASASPPPTKDSSSPCNRPGIPYRARRRPGVRHKEDEMAQFAADK